MWKYADSTCCFSPAETTQTANGTEALKEYPSLAPIKRIKHRLLLYSSLWRYMFAEKSNPSTLTSYKAPLFLLQVDYTDLSCYNSFIRF